MPELADIFRRYGRQYRQKYADGILPSHLRAMRDIEHCRTESMGGHLYRCENHACGQFVYSYHSCKNRHCPKCQNDQAEIWLNKQQDKLLPVQHFLVTATLPAELRSLARSNQKTVYNILFKTSACAILILARDPRFIGGEIGMTGVLHTWDKTCGYHPHVHYLVPAGGLSPDHSEWRAARSNNFLIRVELISAIFKAKFRDELKKTGLFDLVPDEVWQKNWVVHCEPVGSGREAAIYLARYVFRVAISNNRIVSIDNDQITFRCLDAKTRQWYLKTLPALDFIHRFLQHVLPKSFQKVRYYGLFAHTNRNLLEVARYILGAPLPSPEPAKTENAHPQLCCPKCNGALRLVEKIPRPGRGPPHSSTSRSLPYYC
jgi:hypothetical protein